MVVVTVAEVVGVSTGAEIEMEVMICSVLFEAEKLNNQTEMFSTSKFTQVAILFKLNGCVKKLIHTN